MIATDPFPHVVLDDVFPEPFYRRLLAEWPVRSDLEQGTASLIVTRGGVSTGREAELPPCWREARAALIEGTVAMGEAFGFSGLAVFSDLLAERRRAHILAPHVDGLNCRLSALLYLAEDNSRPHLGTILYRHVAGPEATPPPVDHTMVNQAQFAEAIGADATEAKVVEFRPNRLLVMVNSSTTWHGQRLVEDYRRKTYNAFLG